MGRSLSPREAEAEIAAGGVDIIDVREPHEYAQGHVPGARNVPLSEFKKAPLASVHGDRVLMVCASGMRSQTASALASQAGVAEVSDLAGGTRAWEAAGLPLEGLPGPAAPKPVAPKPDASVCAIPEPGLDVIVGANMRELRSQRSLSLDQVARMTGLSRTLLGQIELGKTAPSVSMVWQIAQAFNVHFSALLSAPQRLDTAVLRLGEAKRLVSPDGRFSSRALYPFAEKPDAEFYELFLAAHSREDAHAHQPGTRENLIVARGRLDLHVGDARHELNTGDAIVFTADVPHSYVNPGNEECWMYLVMTYSAKENGVKSVSTS